MNSRSDLCWNNLCFGTYSIELDLAGLVVELSLTASELDLAEDAVCTSRLVDVAAAESTTVTKFISLGLLKKDADEQ